MSHARKCPQCGYSTTNPQAKFCRSCGRPFPAKISVDPAHSRTRALKSSQPIQKRCLKCGNVKHDPTARYCRVCGGVLDDTAISQPTEEFILPEFDDIIRIAQEKKKRQKKDKKQKIESVDQAKAEIEAAFPISPSISPTEEKLDQKITEILSKVKTQPVQQVKSKNKEK